MSEPLAIGLTHEICTKGYFAGDYSILQVYCVPDQVSRRSYIDHTLALRRVTLRVTSLVRSA
jgi:hypothetical protein